MSFRGIRAYSLPHVSSIGKDRCLREWNPEANAAGA